MPASLKALCLYERVCVKNIKNEITPLAPLVGETPVLLMVFEFLLHPR